MFKVFVGLALRRKSKHIRKNGKNRQGKQNYICVKCDRQSITSYDTHQGYSDEFR